MDIKNALKNISKSHEKDELNVLYTPWGEQLDTDRVLEEYPRPQMRRDNYCMLNGYWEYCIIPTDRPVVPGQPFEPDGLILVPFSPESLLSGVNRQLKPDEYLWYQKMISLRMPETADARCLLHFDAADQEADIYLNGRPVFHHQGGYLPFTVEIPEGFPLTFLLQVRIRDVSDTSWHARGKQTLKRGGMFYTAQSGLWQSVWYEWVPRNHICSLRLTPDYDSATCLLELISDHRFRNISLTDEKGQSYPLLSSQEHLMKNQQISVRIRFSLPEGEPLRSWSPEDPYLYPLHILADDDTVQSYFAMRLFSAEKDESGICRFCLNHKPYFLHGILDQGYWPDGLMTAPSDEALIYDISLARKHGYNMIRKHIKIEPLRWYYHCDRLGMIVWQDMVNGGTSYHMPYVCYLPTLLPFTGKLLKDHHYLLLSRSDEKGKEEWLRECRETILHLYNVPSVAVWVPFNEAWGQFDSAKVCRMIRSLDSSRLIDAASGWFDQGCGDFRSIHNYFRKLKAEPEASRACVISEYGGYACHIPGHSSIDRVFGYRRYNTCKELSKAYRQLLEENLFPLEQAGLSGGVYTQLSDIEEEVNGLVTYDRRVEKI